MMGTGGAKRKALRWVGANSSSRGRGSSCARGACRKSGGKSNFQCGGAGGETP